jgi:hypothetical protein
MFDFSAHVQSEETDGMALVLPARSAIMVNVVALELDAFGDKRVRVRCNHVFVVPAN